MGLTIDTPSERDEVIPNPNRDEPLVIVDGRMAGGLEGAEIDYETVVVNGESRSQFTLLPPTTLR
jgi:Fe-S cluster assembly iron-binding protein IscA